MDEADWLRRTTNKDVEVRIRAASSGVERPLKIWEIQATDKDIEIRRIAALSDAKRPLGIWKIQATDKDIEVRKAVFDRKGIEIVLFKGVGIKEWSYFTKKSHGKVALPRGEPKTIHGIETKEGVLVIGDKGKVAVLGKPGKTEKLPDIRASYLKRLERLAESELERSLQGKEDSNS